VSSWLPAALAGAAVLVLTGRSAAGSRLARLRSPEPSAGFAPPPTAGMAALAALAGALAAGPVAAALAVAGVLLLRRTTENRRVLDSRRRERRRTLEALSLLATDLRAGRSPAEALATAADVAIGRSGEALAAAAGQARLGGDVSAALLVDGSAVPEVLSGLAACWSVCGRAGSGLATAVERLEEALRAAEAQRRAVDAELAAPRATAGLLAVLPLGGVLLAVGLGAHPVQLLLHTPLGVGCLVAGLALDGAGLLWTRRLVQRASAP
jgi:tight adherence protein B